MKNQKFIAAIFTVVLMVSTLSINAQKWLKKEQDDIAKTSYEEDKGTIKTVKQYNCDDRIMEPVWFTGDEYDHKAHKKFKKMYGESYNGKNSIKVHSKVLLSDIQSVKSQVTVEDARKRAWQNARVQFVDKNFDTFKKIAEVGGSKVIDEVSLKQSMYHWVSVQDVNMTPIFTHKQEFFEDTCTESKGIDCFMWCYVDNTLLEKRLKELEADARAEMDKLKNEKFEDWFKEWQQR